MVCLIASFDAFLVLWYAQELPGSRKLARYGKVLKRAIADPVLAVTMEESEEIKTG